MITDFVQQVFNTIIADVDIVDFVMVLLPTA